MSWSVVRASMRMAVRASTRTSARPWPILAWPLMKTSVAKPTPFRGLKVSSFCLREIHLSNKKTVVFIDIHHEARQISFNELRQLAVAEKAEKGRDLVRVSKSGSQAAPVFRLLSPKELEVAVRKARLHKKMLSHEVVDLDSIEVSDLSSSSNEIDMKTTRMKEKQLVISANINQHDLEIAAGRIIKWLEKGKYVNVVIKRHGSGDVEQVLERLKSRCGEDLLKERGDFLIIKTH